MVIRLITIIMVIRVIMVITLMIGTNGSIYRCLGLIEYGTVKLGTLWVATGNYGNYHNYE